MASELHLFLVLFPLLVIQQVDANFVSLNGTPCILYNFLFSLLILALALSVKIKKDSSVVFIIVQGKSDGCFLQLQSLTIIFCVSDVALSI